MQILRKSRSEICGSLIESNDPIAPAHLGGIETTICGSDQIIGRRKSRRRRHGGAANRYSNANRHLIINLMRMRLNGIQDPSGNIGSHLTAGIGKQDKKLVPAVARNYIGPRVNWRKT